MSPKSWRTSSLKVGVGTLEVVFVLVVGMDELVVTGGLVVVDEVVLVDEVVARERATTTAATTRTMITIATVTILEIAVSFCKYGLKFPPSD